MGEMTPILAPILKKSDTKNGTDYKISMATNEMALNPQLNKSRAKALKNTRKAERKAAKRVSFADDNSMMAIDNDHDRYDFATDFQQS